MSREQPRTLVSRSFPGNYGRIKYGTSSSIANKCCKRHTTSGRRQNLCIYGAQMYRVILCRVYKASVTNATVTRSAYRRRQGADKCDLFAIISSSALSLVVAFVIVLRRLSLASGMAKPISCFGQVTTHNFYEHFMATPFGHRKAFRSRTSRDRRRLRL